MSIWWSHVFSQGLGNNQAPLAWRQFPRAEWFLARWRGLEPKYPKVRVEAHAITPATATFVDFDVRLWCVHACHLSVRSGSGSASLTPPLAQAAPRPGESVSSETAPTSTSVAKLEERLRAMEETNKKLAEELEKTRREHDEQMKQILKRVEDLSGRSSDRENGGRESVNVGAAGQPRERGPVGRRRNPRAGLHRGAVCPLLARTGIPAPESFSRREVAAGRQLRPRLPVPDRGRGVSAPSPFRVPDRCDESGVRPTRSRPIAASSCPASESSSTATSPSGSSTSSRSTGGWAARSTC